MIITDKHVFFFSKNDPFSNGHPSPFICNCFGAKQFSCVEQYMMYSKAMLFDQDEIANEIMNTDDPRTHKQLGRSIPNFDEKYGFNFAQDIVANALFFKYTQNHELQQKLFSCIGKTFVETSPYDKIGGIGLGKDDNRIHDESNGNGQNLLGKLHNKIIKKLYKSTGTQNFPLIDYFNPK